MIELTVTCGLVAGAIGVADTVPYLRDVVRRSTVPHRGTWLIWTVIEIVALEAQRADGARWSLVPLLVQATGTCLVFVLAIRFGQGGLSRADTAVVALAGVGVVGWQVADEPVVATTCVIVADLLAAIMMVPKTWREPHSETLSTFVLASLGGAAMIGAVGSSSAALLVYPVYFAFVNGVLAGVIGYRRAVLGDRSPAVRRPAEPVPGEPVRA